MAIFGDRLNQLLRRPQSGDQVRLGAGVVGHTSYVVIAAIIVIGIVALTLANNTAVCIDVVLVLGGIVAYYLNGTWKFADKHPDAAAIGGTAWPKPAATPPVKPATSAPAAPNATKTPPSFAPPTPTVVTPPAPPVVPKVP